jgi:hypothetical protein
MPSAITTPPTHHYYIISSFTLQGSSHGGYRHGKKGGTISNSTHRFLPRGVVSKPSERSPEEHRTVVGAMCAGRSAHAKELHLRKRDATLAELEQEASRKAIRVSDQAGSKQKGQRPNDTTTRTKLEIAFPKGPLRTAAAAATQFNVSPGFVSYTRRGMSQLLLLDHSARTFHALSLLEKEPADYIVTKVKWDETKQTASSKFNPFSSHEPRQAIQDAKPIKHGLLIGFSVIRTFLVASSYF